MREVDYRRRNGPPDAPLTLTKAKEYTMDILANVHPGYVMSPPTLDRILKHAIASVRAAKAHKILSAEYCNSSAAQQARIKQQQSNRRTFGQKVGIIYVDEGREIIRRQDEEILAQKERREARLHAQNEAERIAQIA